MTLRERSAFALRGWIALLAISVGMAALVPTFGQALPIPHLDRIPGLGRFAARADAQAPVPGRAVAVMIAAGLLVLLSVAGLLINTAGQTRVLTRWGQYRGTVRGTGLLWANPLLRRRRVDVRVRHWHSEPIGVVDRTGAPIVVQLLIVWRVKETARALFSVTDHESYLREQLHAVLTRTTSPLPCDSIAAPGPALRDGNWLGDELTHSVAAEVEVYSVQPLGLDYGPEVAETVRRRRLADLDAGVRSTMVDDAIESATLAVQRLERAIGHELDDAERSGLMEQLLLAFVAPASSGNQLLISLAQSSSLIGGPPGAIPTSSAGRRYFLIVLRSSPREAPTWLFDRPTHQWT
ncbi:SPFH domain / Band 7 family protein [Streptomyces sp. SceaMP-e96]|uniref:SPFH domain-containing protein n=1 Tax=Streptomyces TaxID=1883 RepID=UPI0008239757|nr:MULTISPECIES: SPFH domain-containing protein [unclassified Streptomyces]MYT17784.1 SPFH domain-containing protein [Streptomyces sp. SID4951]SCK46874.1 SPFH domain / Band 7 family protein [Streptomyces sp. SceaMP-e96]